MGLGAGRFYLGSIHAVGISGGVPSGPATTYKIVSFFYVIDL
jgi:uncharacterized membrane protein (DUF441 family)